MEKSKDINLFDFMQEKVDILVKAYKTDFDYDKDALLDKKASSNIYYWYLRECGTELLRDYEIFAKGSWDNTKATYYKDEALKCYKIEVTKRGTKYAYGNIEEIKVSKFVKFVEDNTKEYTATNISIELTNNKKYEVKVTKEEEKKYDGLPNAVKEKLNLDSLNEIRCKHIISYDLLED